MIKLTDIVVLRFNNDFVFIECEFRLLHDFLQCFLQVFFGIGRYGPEVMTGGCRFRCDAMETTHMEATPVRVINRF